MVCKQGAGGERERVLARLAVLTRVLLLPRSLSPVPLCFPHMQHCLTSGPGTHPLLPFLPSLAVPSHRARGTSPCPHRGHLHTHLVVVPPPSHHRHPLPPSPSTGTHLLRTTLLPCNNEAPTLAATHTTLPLLALSVASPPRPSTLPTTSTISALAPTPLPLPPPTLANTPWLGCALLLLHNAR